jgi:hypothetical protein
MEEYIDTTKGYLTAQLWHGAYVVMEFDNNYHAPVSGEDGIRLLKKSLLEFCNFKIDKDNNGLCILTYKGAGCYSFSTSVTLTSTGYKRLIEILDAALAQAYTPEEIAEQERHYKEWQNKRKS